MQSPVPWQDFCTASAASSQAGWEMGKGWPAWAETVELLSSSALGPVIPRVTPGWRGPVWDIANRMHFKSWMGIGSFHLSSIQVESSEAGGGAVATGVSQSPSKRAFPQHWRLLALPAHLMGWCCVTVDHRVRQYFVTAILKELGITAKPTEKYPHCKEDTNFLKQLVLQVHQASASMVSLIETSRTFEEEGWKQGSWENKCSFF